MIHNNPLEQKGIIQQIEKANIVEGLFRHYSTNRNTLLRSYVHGEVIKELSKGEIIMSVINGIAFSNPNAEAEENKVMAAIIEKKVKQKEFEKFMEEYRLANPEFDLTISSKVDVK